MKQIVLALCLLVNVCSFANEIKAVKKGDTVPFDGYVITVEFEKNLRQINETNKLLEAKNVTLEQLSVVNDKRADHYRKEAEKAVSEAQSEQLMGSVKGGLGFVFGVLATSLAAYAAITVVR